VGKKATCGGRALQQQTSKKNPPSEEKIVASRIVPFSPFMKEI